MKMAGMLLAEFSLANLPFTPVMIAAGIATAVLVGVGTVFAIATNQGVRDQPSTGIFGRLLYGIFSLTVVALAVTSFGSIAQFGHMSGYALLIHVAAAGAFVFLLLAVSCLYLPHGSNAAGPSCNRERWWVTRWSAWFLVLSSLAAAGTMFLSMLPILNTGSLLEVAALHRYAGLAVAVATVLHVYALGCSRLGWR